MPLLDCHTHATGFDLWNLGVQRFPTSQSARDLAFKLGAAGVDYAACFPVATSFYFDNNAMVRGRVAPGGPEAFPYELVNKQHLREVALFGNGSLLPFLCVDPVREVDRQLALLERTKGTIFGLKLHTRTTDSSPLDLLGTDLLRFAEEANLPFMIHSADSPENCRPGLILEVAKASPGVRFCIAHAAAFERDSLEGASAVENVFVDPSPLLTNCVEASRSSASPLGASSYGDPQSVLQYLIDHLPGTLVWGSDEPWTSYCGPDGEVWTTFSYFDEVALLRSRSAADQQSIGWESPCRWLFGDEAGRAEEIIAERMGELSRFGALHPTDL